MTLYETMFILHPERGGAVKEHIERLKKIVEERGGTVAHLEEWGLRDLAYRIQKQMKGYYTLLQYRSTARVVEELERTLKLSDGVLRYLTIRVDESAQAAPPAAPKKLSGESGKSEEDVAKAEPQA
ncbi:MAG TPA: 30S ribosomal protein S6 [Candidatus Binatia bacterium]